MIDAQRKSTQVDLAGKCFISTRPLGRSDELRLLLQQYGAQLYDLPMIELSEIVCQDESAKVLANYDQYLHIAFTSAYGFEFFFNKIEKHNHFESIISKVKIASIGAKTSELIRSYGLEIDLDAHAKTGEEFAQILAEYLKGKNAHVIWATGSLSPDHLTNKVKKVADITRINLYTNQLPKTIDMNLVNKIKKHDYDMIVLASPSAFRNLYAVTASKELKVVCIGQTTAKEVTKYGITPAAIAKEPSAQGITNAVLNHYRNTD